MDKLFFDTWESLLRTFIISVLSYTALIAMLRISRKRNLTQMNAFDFIITIALGSAFATVTLNKYVVLGDGILVLSLLILLQYYIAWLVVRYKKVNNLISSKPAILVYKGDVYTNILKRQRITQDELDEALRRNGLNDISEVMAKARIVNNVDETVGHNSLRASEQAIKQLIWMER